MSKIKYEVGDEVLVKARVSAIRRKLTWNGTEDYYVDLEIPYWHDAYGVDPNKVHITASQKLIFRIKKDEKS